MPLYESTFISRQDLSRQDVAKLAETFGAIVEQGGGRVVKNEYWGLRSMAYRVNKNRRGHYCMLGIDAPAPAIKEMERNMRLNEDLLRTLIIRVDELDEAPSAMMQQASRRDDSYNSDAEGAEAAPRGDRQ